MIWLITILVILIICFGSVLLFGAPYMPTLKQQISAALTLAELKRGETLLELGCGDGRVLIAAAKKGYKAVGYELNPLLFVICWLRTRRYQKHVKVRWGDFWQKSWPEAEAIFIFLLPKYMSKLDKQIRRWKQKPVKVVSFAFQIPDREPDGYKDGVYLYRYK